MQAVTVDFITWLNAFGFRTRSRRFLAELVGRHHRYGHEPYTVVFACYRLMQDPMNDGPEKSGIPITHAQTCESELYILSFDEPRQQ